MTNAELLAKIKAEVERIKESYDVYLARVTKEDFLNELDNFLSFLSTLESETTYDTQQYTPRPSVDIEDVARIQFASHAKVFDKKRKAVFDWNQFKEVASIFYGFGKKDSSSTLESEKPNQDELEEELDRFIASGKSVTVEDCGTYRVSYHDFKKVARHFAKWGAEHTKNRTRNEHYK